MPAPITHGSIRLECVAQYATELHEGYEPITSAFLLGKWMERLTRTEGNDYVHAYLAHDAELWIQVEDYDIIKLPLDVVAFLCTCSPPDAF